MHNWCPNANGLNRAPYLLRSKRHSPVSRGILTPSSDSSLSAGCIRIHTMPSTLQSVLSKVGLSVTNISKNGEDVAHIFNSLNNSINAGV